MAPWLWKMLVLKDLTRISETIVSEAKQQLQHHLEESKTHVERLTQLLTTIGDQPSRKNAITIAWLSSRYSAFNE